VIPEPTSFNGDDTRDLSSGPGDPHAAFRKGFRLWHSKGDAQTFLDYYRLIPYFASDVAWAEQQLLVELDVMAGEAP
jgi:hypothetical protein